MMKKQTVRMLKKNEIRLNCVAREYVTYNRGDCIVNFQNNTDKQKNIFVRITRPYNRKKLKIR